MLIWPLLNACSAPVAKNSSTDADDTTLFTGADQLDKLVPLLEGKRVALVVNQTSVVGDTHLVDTLRASGINLIKIFAPEHGFRGTAANGEVVADGIDLKTGLLLVSLYGTNRKPTPEQLTDIDVVVFDIQDVGVRFYTYLSTMHLVMEACAENNKKIIVLDRPNPHGDMVDGPVMQDEFKSFVGMHPIPIAHGMTLGELARMINGEGWLANAVRCDLEVIPLQHWRHSDTYNLPVSPSPNLPNNHAIRLYPSLCLFEGTVISVGRGTQMPFEAIGHPSLTGMPFSFTPITIEGVAVNPPHEGKVCYGLDLRQEQPGNQLDLSYLIRMYEAFPYKDTFFNTYFERLAGTRKLREQIQSGLDEAAIRDSWKDELEAFRALRKKYLLYE